MATRATLTSGFYSQHRMAVLQELFASRSSPQKAAEALANQILSEPKLESALNKTWGLMIAIANELPKEHIALVELLTCLARLPPAKDHRGEQHVLYDMRVWKDLPMFAWEVNDEWNGLQIPPENGPDRDSLISKWLNTNSFAALLTRTSVPALSFMLQGLWSLRSALEYPTEDASMVSKLTYLIPAAAIWISILGSQIYASTEEYAPSAQGGQPGLGGPLWKGKHGFCPERWNLWKQRFGEISHQTGIDGGTRGEALQAAIRMSDIESGK